MYKYVAVLSYIELTYAVYITVQRLYMKELNPIGIITALFVVFFFVCFFLEWNGLESHLAAISLAECVNRVCVLGGGALWEGPHTKDLPILEDSDKSKQISAGRRSLLPRTYALRGFAKVHHLQ